MTQTRSARSTSRRNTPLSPPKSTANVSSWRETGPSRQTRSSTHDLPAIPEIDDSTERSKRKTKGKGKQSKVPDTVGDAIEPVEAEQGAENVDDDEAVDEERTLSGQSLSSHGDITSHLQDKLADLDLELIITNLPLLYHHSETLLSLFASDIPANLEVLHNEILQTSSRAGKRLDSLLAGFDFIKQNYSDGEYIDASLVVDALSRIGAVPPHGGAGAQIGTLLSLANVAHLVSSVYRHQRQDEDAKTLLRSSFDSLRPFTFSGISGQLGKSFDELASINLELRTQVLIQSLFELQDDPNFDADNILRDYFFADDNTLLGFYNGEDQYGLPKKYEVLFLRRITAIRKCFSTDVTNPVDFDGLDAAFPWTDLVVRLALWAQLTLKEVRSDIAAHGGVGEIQKRLQTGLEAFEEARVESLAPAPDQDEMAKQAGSTSLPKRNVRGKKTAHRKKQIVEGIAALRESLGKAAAGRELGLDQAPEKGQEAEQGDEVARSTGDELAPTLRAPTQTSVVPSLQNQIVRSVLKQHEAQSNKENMDPQRRPPASFNDRQLTAERINFDSQEDGDGDSSAVQRPLIGRRAPTGEDGDDDDNTFEEDKRPPRVRRRPVKRARRQVDDEESEEDGDDDVLNASFTNRPPNGQQGGEVIEIDSDEHVAQVPGRFPSRGKSHLVNTAAEGNVNTQPGRVFKGAAPRRPFSEIEVGRLVDLIDRCGASWSLIKKADERSGNPLLRDRNGMNLRDKARNIKMSCLRAGSPLPNNFDQVLLGAGYIKILESQGIKYEGR